MDFTFGIEEEFFVVCEDTQLLEPTAHEAFLARAKQLSDGAVRRELLQSQVEAATPVCNTFGEARAHLERSRRALATAGRESGLAVISAGTHPTADWPLQQQTDKQRYDAVMAELQILGLRNLVCGMHVHVEVPDDDLRLDVMRRAIPFLPILLALSTSSPFWRGMNTGFSSYRLTSYDELPRTGLPPLFSDWLQYRGYIETLREAGVIRDASYIWWAIRPSHKYRTLELRIPDACTSLDDALTVAAIYRCLVCALIADRTINSAINSPTRALAKENKWRVQRFGLRAELIDPFRERAAIDAAGAARRLVEMLRRHAAALDCLAEVEHVETILQRGTSADRQLAVYHAASAEGCSHEQALQKVKAWLQEETLACCEVAAV
jgi:glutamate---cysteine ligase / carboxylate-amine ligase